MKKISYIFPIYNESGNIDLLYKTIDSITKPLEKRYDLEIVFINDGSKDDSLEKLITIQKKDPRITVIDFSRNYGHQIAVTAGLDYVSGDAAIIMDSDLQDPPKVSLELIEQWEEGFVEKILGSKKSLQTYFIDSYKELLT
jgi:glycosyltransferase involved in cell wall biosynthesis